MNIEVSEKTKGVVVSLGPNKLFGERDKRPVSPAERSALFDRVWTGGMSIAVAAAEVCDSDHALRRLKETYRKFFDPNAEHRAIRYQEMEFIAELTKSAARTELTQLWFIPSSDFDPRVLYVRFETTEERRAFGKLASELGWADEELGLRLVTQFMDNCRFTSEQ